MFDWDIILKFILILMDIQVEEKVMKAFAILHKKQVNQKEPEAAGCVPVCEGNTFIPVI